MNKENTLLVLWIFFGFIFIQAIDAILALLTHLVYFGAATIGISFSVLTIVIPVFTLITYVLAAVLCLKKLRIKSKSTEIYLTEIPKRLFLLFIVIAIFLSPITNKLSGKFAEYYAVQINASDFIGFYGWMYFGIGFSKWITLIVLVIIFFNRYNSEVIKK